MTKRILGRMRADAGLEAFGSTAFRASAAGIDDRRLQVMAHSATQMATDYDVVFSCLPLLSIPVRISVRILQQARQRLLARNGTLVLFQYSHLSEKLLSRYFHWKRLRVVRNFRRRWCMSVRHVNYSVFTITTTSSSYCRRRSGAANPSRRTALPICR